MIKIEIKSEDVKVKEGVSARTNKAYRICEQMGYAFTYDKDGNPNPYPVKVSLSLDENQPPYKIGSYILAPHSLYTDRFNQLVIRPVLVLEPAHSTKTLKAA